jgi:hypothetical protein
MFLSAQTTARTQKRQLSVLKSKYPRYSPSGGTMKEVITAAHAAMRTTAFSLANSSAFFITISQKNFTDQ